MIIATAGHIDHGKTSLVHALTGVDADRLPEEKRRGMTIDLGFAYWPVDDGLTIGFVDVPGHEKFVRTMLAGVARKSSRSSGPTMNTTRRAPRVARATRLQGTRVRIADGAPEGRLSLGVMARA